MGVVLTDAEHRTAATVAFLRSYAERRLNSPLADERRSLPLGLVSDFGRAGLFGLQVPEAYGGLALPHAAVARILIQLGAIDCNACTLVGVHNTLGTPPVRFAPEAVQRQVLPLTATGRSLITSAISETGMGSNLRELATRADRRPDGSYVLSGTKRWISLGGDAGFCNVFARLHDESQRPIGVTGFLVDTSSPGFVVGPECLTLGLRAVPQNTVTLEDVVVGADAVLGGEGDGLDVAKRAFRAGRIALAAAALGGAMRSLDLAHRFAVRRIVATGRLAENGRTQQILADGTAAVTAVRTLVDRVTAGLDAGETVPDLLYFTAKVLGCELMWQVMDASVQLLGARGYMDNNVVGQMYRDYRLYRIFEGSTEAMAVYLGTDVLKRRVSLTATLAGAPPGILELAGECESLAVAATATPQQRHVLANAVGVLACWSALAAVTGAVAGRSPAHARAADWCARRLREQLRTARREVGGSVPTSPEIADDIATFHADIGDPEQRHPGTDYELDALLRR